MRPKAQPQNSFFGKVHIFWEGHKILRNLQLTFDWSKGKIAKCRCLFFWGGGGHFAVMPTVAHRRGVGVKNRENLPMSYMDGPLCIHLSRSQTLVCHWFLYKTIFANSALEYFFFSPWFAPHSESFEHKVHNVSGYCFNYVLIKVSRLRVSNRVACGFQTGWLHSEGREHWSLPHPPTAPKL